MTSDSRLQPPSPLLRRDANPDPNPNPSPNPNLTLTLTLTLTNSPLIRRDAQGTRRALMPFYDLINHRCGSRTLLVRVRVRVSVRVRVRVGPSLCIAHAAGAHCAGGVAPATLRVQPAIPCIQPATPCIQPATRCIQPATPCIQVRTEQGAWRLHAGCAYKRGEHPSNTHRAAASASTT